MNNAVKCGILTYWQANKLACYYFTDAGRWRWMLGSETDDLIAHGKSRNQGFTSDGVHCPSSQVSQVWGAALRAALWACSGRLPERNTQRGWSSTSAVSLFWVWGQTLPHPTGLCSANATPTGPRAGSGQSFKFLAQSRNVQATRAQHRLPLPTNTCMTAARSLNMMGKYRSFVFYFISFSKILCMTHRNDLTN